MPVCSEKMTKRKSKYSARGEMIYEPATMTKSLFKEYVIQYLIPDAIRIGQKLSVKKIVIQMDQAGGHGGGKGNMKMILDEFNQIGSSCSPEMKFIVQPSKSPDFNALDLGMHILQILFINLPCRCLVFIVCWSAQGEMCKV